MPFIARGGSADVSIPSGQSIIIGSLGAGTTTIFKLLGGGNFPASYVFQQYLTTSTVTLGPFTNGAQYRINASLACDIEYEVGVNPSLSGGGGGGITAVSQASDYNSAIVVPLASKAPINATQAAQVTAGATAALLNAAKTALKDPAGGADISLGGTGGGSFTLAAWDANNPPAAVSSGTAPTGTQPTAYVVISSGVVAVSGPDAITALRTNDAVEWVAATSTWVREAGPVPDPITVSASLTLTSAHNDVGLLLATTQTITLNDGLGAGFGLPIKGPCTFTGTAVVNDLRRSTGLTAANLWSFLIKTGNNGTHDTYDWTGDKV